MTATVTRRAALAATTLLSAPAAALLPEAATAQIRRTALGPLILPVKQDDTVAPGHARGLLARWGDRVTADAPAWTPGDSDPDAVAAQFGWDARVAAFATAPPAADGVPRGVLAVTHPEVFPPMAFPDARDRPALAAALAGASLLNLTGAGGRWIVVDGGFQSRRLTWTTLCRRSGPGGDGAVRGIVGARGGCATPWGTLLLGEDAGTWLPRLAGLDARFADGAGFGWVVEIDPADPVSLPVKRTALGRLAHGDVAATTARDGRAVVYLCDRRPGGGVYRFVSAGAAGTDALDAGMLSAARLDGDRVRWADPADASPFDTPSGLAIDPRGARLLIACRGSAARPAGHVIELLPDGGDPAAESARTNLLFAAGDPAAGGRYGRGGLPPGSAWPEHPDGIAMDTRGRAWIATAADGPPVAVGRQADGLFACDLDGPGRGVPLPLYGAPRAASVGGVALAGDGDALFAGIRHPGAERGATFARPGTRWPGFVTGVPPRSAAIVLTRDGGGPLGG